ncbi:hypothetical protein CDAR_286031 [Caerostris darwini]|uniref:Uncharacterized protein n=1 Tax=Caerostris darwini TaxID=1538125 RepID=A0AAV4N4D2_9ARAC|nr:hypothetical protein CDAR_286031 [Caerostris darwini]
MKINSKQYRKRKQVIISTYKYFLEFYGLSLVASGREIFVRLCHRDAAMSTIQIALSPVRNSGCQEGRGKKNSKRSQVELEDEPTDIPAISTFFTRRLVHSAVDSAVWWH